MRPCTSTIDVLLNAFWILTFQDRDYIRRQEIKRILKLRENNVQSRHDDKYPGSEGRENFKTIHLITHVAAQYRTSENTSKAKTSL
jgi:hypothetical protein